MSKVGKVMKKDFFDNVLAPKCGKRGLFSKAWVSVRVRVRVRVSFSSGENGHFPLDGVQGWESDEKRMFGQLFGPKAWKKWTFFKS